MAHPKTLKNPTNIKIILLNILCLFLLAYFSILATRQLTAESTIIDADFAVLYHSLHQNNHPYTTYYSRRIVRIQKVNGATKVWFAPDTATQVNLNTPTMNVFVKYMVNISDQLSTNVAIWILASLLGAAISLAVLMHWVDASHAKIAYFFPFLLIFWMSWTNLYNLQQGQVTLLLLPLLSIAFVVDNAKKYILASILLGLLASLKLFFLIFAFLYIGRRQWHLLFVFLGAFLFFFLLPKLYFSWADYHTYFQLLQNHVLIIKRAVAQMNGSILGVIGNIVRLSGLPVTFHNQIFIISGVLTLYVFIRWLMFDYCCVNQLPQFRDAIRFCFLIVIALLCSPLGWLYYYLFLLLPVVVIFKISQRYALSRSVFVFFALALILPMFCFFGLSDKSIFLQSVRALALFSSLLCWLICLRIVTYDILDEKPAVKYHRYFLLAILFVYMILSFTVFSLDAQMSYMLQWDKTTYLKTVAPGVWVLKNEGAVK